MINGCMHKCIHSSRQSGRQMTSEEKVRKMYAVSMRENWWLWHICYNLENLPHQSDIAVLTKAKCVFFVFAPAIFLQR